MPLFMTSEKHYMTRTVWNHFVMQESQWFYDVIAVIYVMIFALWLQKEVIWENDLK